MNTALWIVQGLLAFMFLMGGMMKLRTPKEEFVKKMAWANDFSQGQIRAIGTAEVLGVMGLILPLATGILPILTPVAAVGFVLLMLGAASTHMRRGNETQMVMMNVMLIVMTAFVAWGRF